MSKRSIIIATAILVAVIAIAYYALQPKTTNPFGMEFVLIQEGEFMMGSPPNEKNRDDDEDLHQVRISLPFYLGKHPVTQAQWQTVMGKNPSKHAGDPNLPVENVSWNDVQEFIGKLNERESGRTYRLPTEAEWEYACRAGTTTAYSFGDDPGQLGEYAWYEGSSNRRTHPVGQLKPNAWGLYDMHGNVFEWVQDWYDKNYYRQSPPNDPQGPSTGNLHVLRGGSFLHYQCVMRCADRDRRYPQLRLDSVGFRVVLLP